MVNRNLPEYKLDIMALQKNLFGETQLLTKSTKRAQSVVIKSESTKENKRDKYSEDSFYIIPSFSLHPDELYIYGKKEWLKEPNTRSINSLQNLINNQTHGKLSTKARQKAKRAIKYLLTQATTKKVYNPKFRTQFNFKVNFITLTLSSTQQHSTQVIKRVLLNQFFIEAKKKWGLENYVWRYEKQKNGNAHFHILSDKFIPWLELRETWNRIQNKLGYTAAYQQKYHKKSPNSTDIHSLKKVKNVYKYVTKYMTKAKNINNVKVHRSESLIKEKTEKIEQSVSNGAKQYLGRLTSNGREWACSRNLSNITGARDEYNGEYTLELEKLRKSQATKEVVKDYVSMYYFNTKELNENDYPKLNSLLNSYLALIFGKRETVNIDNTGSVYQVPIYDN